MPEDAVSAAIWMVFRREHGDAAGNLETLLELNSAYAHDQQVRRLAVSAVLIGPPSDHHPEGVKGILSNYLRDYPNQTEIVQIHASDAEELLAHPIFEGAAERWKAIADLEAQVVTGELPTGLASALQGKAQATYLARRVRPTRQIRSTWTTGTAKLAAALAREAVMVDITAVFTLATLTSDSAAALLGTVRLIGHQDQLRDLNSAREEAARDRATATLSSARGSLASSDALDQASRRFDRMHRTYGVIDRESSGFALPGPLAELDELSDLNDSWLSCVKAAASKGAIMWCDDVGLASFAHLAGVQTFSTFDLIDTYAATQEAFVSARVAIVAEILHNWGFGYAFEADVYDLAAALDGDQLRGGHTSLRWASGTTVEFTLTHFTSKLVESIPLAEKAGSWAALVGDLIGGDTSAQAALPAIYARAITDPRLTPGALFRIHEAIKSGTGDVALIALKASFLTVLGRVETNPEMPLGAPSCT